MKIQSLRKILKSKPDTDPGYLFHTNLTYPTFPDNTSNFITDYQSNAASFNKYALLKRGDQVVKFDEEDYEDGWDFLSEVTEAVTDVHLESWARLYYALSLSYNPLYNVDGTTVKETTQRQRTDAYGAQSGSSVFGATSQTDNIGAVAVTDNFGARSLTDNIGAVSKTDQYGNKSETLGSHTDTQTQKSVSFNASTQKETGATENVYGSQTNTEAAYTDTHSELARSDSHSEAARSDTHNTAARTDTHTGLARNDSHSENAHSDTHTDAAFSETETRKGNIGVTMSQQLLEAEWEFRKKSFFSMIINQMLDEVGFYYNGGIGL